MTNISLGRALCNLAPAQAYAEVVVAVADSKGKYTLHRIDAIGRRGSVHMPVADQPDVPADTLVILAEKSTGD